MTGSMPERATVFLVGAGPGDPDLLTVKAARLLSQADVVVHDALVDAAVLALASPTTELIDVGKRPGRPVPQELITTLLIDLGRRHRCVVRLKGGDPYVFGRGGEEALALQEAGVPFEVVPGVTSAVAAPALAGVPVTHRGLAAAVTIVTGHRRQGDEQATDWEALARVGGTVVVLMGVAERAAIAAKLVAGGRAAATPVAVVERAGTAAQRVVRGRLDELAALEVSAPATIVIGAVAALDLSSPGRRIAGEGDVPASRPIGAQPSGPAAAARRWAARSAVRTWALSPLGLGIT
jgi:uroporphyrin-III C-methyltransferase